MNISNIDPAPPESKPLSPKTDTEGTDLFSILMASITVGNGIQQGNYSVTTASVGDIAGNAIVSAPNGEFTGQDKGLLSGMPLTPLSAATTQEVTGQDTGSDPDVTDLFAGLGKPASEGSQVPAAVFKNSINVGNEDSDGAILPVVEGKEQVNLMPTKGHDNLTHPHLNPLPEGEETILLPPLQGEGQGRDGVNKVFSEQKVVNGNLREIKADTPEKALTGDSVRLPAQVEKAEPVDLSNAKSLLPQAVKGIKEGAGIEVKESNVKVGTIVSGNDKAQTGKGSDVGNGIVTSFGWESINPGLLHASAETLPESDPALRNIHRPQIDPVDLVAQVSGKIKADFKSEGGEVRMELHPESLGHLKIEIKVEGGVIRANILTENAMVKDTIESNLSMLRSSLEENGLRIDQLSVWVGHQQSGAFAERKDIQIRQGSENVDASRYEGEEPVNESWYSVGSWQEQGVSIFA